MNSKILTSFRIGGAVLMDVMVSSAITVVLAAGMFTTVVSMQRSSAASFHHVRSQMQQARVIDYVARDLRRALTVQVAQDAGGERLNLTIPDYYDSAGTPRDPSIVSGGINYGTSGGVPVSYFKVGDKAYRSENGRATVIVTDVKDFTFDFTDGGAQAVSVAITFIPKYQFASESTVEVRQATTAFTTTLLRNKRTP